MGLPLSRFQMLSRLCSDDREIRDALASYKLTCVVLHDPDDKRFVARMRKMFPSLHRQTGKDLLFISFINPPKEWEEPDCLGFKHVDSRRLCVESGFDSWLMVNHLLPIVAPDANLPCLLVTDALLSREYVLIDSSVEQFPDQLVQLGEYCLQTEGRFLVSDHHFLEFVSALGSSSLFELPERSIAAALSDVLALSEISHESEENSDAEKWADYRIREWKTAGGNAATDCFRYESAVKREKQRKERLLRPAVVRRSAMSSRALERPNRVDGDTTLSLYSFFQITPKSIQDYDLCHARSRGNILEYNDILEFFVPKRTFDEDKVAYNDKQRMYPKSFKQLAQPLAEFFEREVNLTLVQLMRQYFGIEMPEYYRKFKRDCMAKVRTPKEVSLNACEYPDRLKFVTLGNAYHAYKTMCDPYDIYKMPEMIGGSFLDDWNRIANMRNDIDHPDYYEEDFFGYTEFRRFHSVFISILRDSLWKMEAIGDALRRGEELPKF